MRALRQDDDKILAQTETRSAIDSMLAMLERLRAAM